MNETNGILMLLNMSLTGGVVVGLILILRIFLKRFPKKYLCILWLVPFWRLLSPVLLPSPLSLLPFNPQPLVEIATGNGVYPALNTGIPAIDIPVSLVLMETMPPNPATSADPVQLNLFIFGIIWAAGAGLFLIVNFFRYFRLKWRLREAVPASDERERRIYYSDTVTMPMVVGFIKPRIYLPSMFLKEEYLEERGFVMAHEEAHRKRHDPFMKLLAFAALTIHWFNPLVWAAFFFLCKDMEMACDEAVMEQLGEDKKKGYSLTLLHFEERRSALLVPLAFGESHTKTRIKNILNYKKPAFWVTIAAVLLLAAAAVTLLTNPPSTGTIGGMDGLISGDGASSTYIIGGADGPTAIFLAGKVGDNEQAAEAEQMDVEEVKKKPYGTDVQLDYVSADKISLHGYFGYLVFSLSQGELERAVTLSEAGPIFMQGDNYTEIIGGDGAAMIFTDFYNTGEVQKAVYVYYEENNTIEKFESTDDDVQELIEQFANMTAEGHLTDATVEEELIEELTQAVHQEYGEENGILYGPVAVPEFDSNVYGFLAADGGNVENIWYGLWGRDTGWMQKTELFR